MFWSIHGFFDPFWSLHLPKRTLSEAFIACVTVSDQYLVVLICLVITISCGLHGFWLLWYFSYKRRKKNMFLEKWISRNHPLCLQGKSTYIRCPHTWSWLFFCCCYSIGKPWMIQRWLKEKNSYAFSQSRALTRWLLGSFYQRSKARHIISIYGKIKVSSKHLPLLHVIICRPLLQACFDIEVFIAIPKE